MTKTITPFALAMLMHVTTVLAQPVIVDGSNLPGTSYTSPVVNGPASVAPGAGGAGVTWNLAALSLSVVGTYQVENPSSTPVAATYPSGNFALSITPTGGSALYSYYIVNATAMFELANSVTTTAGSGRNYTPGPRKMLKFPFNYTDTFSSPYATATSSGYDFFTYDGYGTLITPWATYTNVVRIKDNYSSAVGYSLNWYTLSPLLNVLSYDSNSNTYTGLSAPPTSAATIDAAQVAAAISPNPFSGRTTIRIGRSTPLRNTLFVVTDATGRCVSQFPLSTYETPFSSDGLTKGLYFYSIVNDGIKIAAGNLTVL